MDIILIILGKANNVGKVWLTVYAIVVPCLKKNVDRGLAEKGRSVSTPPN